VLSVTGLRAGYGGAPVIEDITFSMEVGEGVAILGRNGMGKTTLIRAICGLRPPVIESGSVHLGVDITHLSPDRIARAGIGLVPQGRQVFGSLTVTENLSIVPRRPGGTWTIERVYEFFPRLEERADSYARHLSGGEQQMLAIGRALMTDPTVLVMDEPSEGLAPAILRTIREQLQSLRLMGLTVLVAEQNVDLAIALSDRVLIIGEHGRIAWEGPSRSLLVNPAPIHTHLGL
jgi:branched-chain amino acid transport system ATP-binding protein